jgi:DNA-binding transcriptional LysR family regulator
MELRQLEYFVAVAEEANFTRAAERVHISQSGVSAQVRALETELGAELLDRSSRMATLTAAGAAALSHAREALAAATALRQAVDDVNGLIRGRLRVGMVVGCEVTPLFDALAAFHRAHPAIELALQEDNSDRLVEGVRSGDTDIALIGVSGRPPAGLESQVIISEGLAALVPGEHPWRDRDRISLAELTAYPMICLPEGTGVRGVLDQACAAAGLARGIALEATAPGAVADLAARGLGIGVLSSSMAAGLSTSRSSGPSMGATVGPADAKRTKPTDPKFVAKAADGSPPGRSPGSIGDQGRPGSLHAVEIDGVDIPALLALVWRPTAGPALRALLPFCRAAFGTEPR